MAEEAHAELGGVCPVAGGLVPHCAVVGIITVGHLGGNCWGGIEDATETTVLVTGGTVDGSAVCGIPTGVVAVAVFDGVDGIIATLVDVAVVTIDTTVMAVFDAGLDDSIVGETCTVIAVAAEAVC